MLKNILVLPLGGESSRFPGLRPKWMLINPSGNMMVADAIMGLDLSEVSSVLFIMLEEHNVMFQAKVALEKQLKKIDFNVEFTVILLPSKTRNQPETIYKGLKQAGVKEASIFVKDCDNFFNTAVTSDNSVSVFDLNDMAVINASNKSYIETNDRDEIINIVEKRVISSRFCVGGYSFEDVQDFYSSFEVLNDIDDLYVSHIVYHLISQNKMFKGVDVTDYVDWGTIEDWERYKAKFSTIFVDIDGTLVESAEEFFEPIWGTTCALVSNCDSINRLYDSGKARIILLTSRSSEYRQITIEQLQNQNIRYHQIIFDLFHSKRIIINDYSKSNPYKSCSAINIKQDCEELAEMLEESLGYNV